MKGTKKKDIMKNLESLKEEKFALKAMETEELEQIQGGSFEQEVTCTPQGNYIDESPIEILTALR